MKIRARLILKLVQLGAMDRGKWRPLLFRDYPKCKHPRQDIHLTKTEFEELCGALEHIRYETKFTLQHHQRLYANRVYGGKLFDA